MKNLGIVLTLAVVACVFQTSSASTAATTMNSQGGGGATSAPDITVTASMTFNGAWNAMYSDMTHPNTSSMATDLCTAVTANSNKVKSCMVNSFSSGSVVASLTLTAASTETSATVISSIDQVKATISASMNGFNIGTITVIVDTTSTATTTTTAPSAATTLSTSVIMYLTVLCATAKAVLF